MIKTSEYLSRNRQLLSKLPGQKIASISRLMDDEPEEELRLEFGPILLKTEQSTCFYITVDEGQGNIIIFDASETTSPILKKIEEFPYQYLVFTEKNISDDFVDCLKHPIIKIEIITQENYSSLMSGFRLTFLNQKSMNFGVYLTEYRIPEVWILKQDEMKDDLDYSLLGSISE